MRKKNESPHLHAHGHGRACVDGSRDGYRQGEPPPLRRPAASAAADEHEGHGHRRKKRPPRSSHARTHRVQSRVAETDPSRPCAFKQSEHSLENRVGACLGLPKTAESGGNK